jgi:hypothetical protein
VLVVAELDQLRLQVRREGDLVHVVVVHAARPPRTQRVGDPLGDVEEHVAAHQLRREAVDRLGPLRRIDASELRCRP